MEVELKLHVLSSVSGGPTAFYDRLAELASLAGQRLGPVEPIALRDIYYDTADGALARAGAGLRMRVENGAAFVTLKTSRRQEGALAVREEYEQPLDAEHLDQVLARIRPLVGSLPVEPDAFAAGRPAGPLVPVLDVITARRARQIGGLGVLTLDRVDYPGLVAHPFFDIEVEAADGLAGEGGLRRVEADLMELAGGHLAPAAISKLERGLGLRAAKETGA